MATVTHHTSLPDSSEKTDFYNLVDNATVSAIVDADIASTAAILDTKLDTISTAGKVDGSAINNLSNIPSGAGTIPLANIPSITNAKLSSGVGTSANNLVALDSSAKLPAVDGSQLTNVKSIGSKTSKNIDTIYQALTDCFVGGYVDLQNGDQAAFKTDSSATPITKELDMSQGGAGTIRMSFGWMVKKNDYYILETASGTIDVYSMKEIPLGA